MTPNETQALYALMCATWRNQPNEPELTAWQLAFAESDPDIAMAAATAVIREDRPFMPRPGEIIGVMRSHDETIPPTPVQALGFYMAGNWDAHPLVRKAADAVEWDRTHPEVADRARFQFRDLYESELRTVEIEQRRGERERLHGGPGDLAALLVGGTEE